MDVKTFKTVVQNMPWKTTILLRGVHGIGKSAIVRQYAKSIGARFFDVRLAEREVGDLLGMPGKVTVTVEDQTLTATDFNPPLWYVACMQATTEKPMVLFLDEINRATREVLNAAFELVLDRRINGKPVGPGCRIFAAINDNASSGGIQYQVADMDPALFSRFAVYDLAPSIEDWLNWATSDGGIHELVTGFVREYGNSVGMFDPPSQLESGKVYADRRAWETYSDALKTADGNGNLFPNGGSFNSDLAVAMGLGIVGVEPTMKFNQYAVEATARIKPEQILKSYPKVQEKVKKLPDTKLLALCEELVDSLKGRDKLTPAEAKNVNLFLADLPAEILVSTWKTMNSAGKWYHSIRNSTPEALAIRGKIKEIVIGSVDKNETKTEEK